MKHIYVLLDETRAAIKTASKSLMPIKNCLRNRLYILKWRDNLSLKERNNFLKKWLLMEIILEPFTVIEYLLTLNEKDEWVQTELSKRIDFTKQVTHFHETETQI